MCHARRLLLKSLNSVRHARCLLLKSPYMPESLQPDLHGSIGYSKALPAPTLESSSQLPRDSISLGIVVVPTLEASSQPPRDTASRGRLPHPTLASSSYPPCDSVIPPSASIKLKFTIEAAAPPNRKHLPRSFVFVAPLWKCSHRQGSNGEP